MSNEQWEGETDHLQGWVSWNEKGFWQCDVFSDDDSEIPVWYCTGAKGGGAREVAEKTFKHFGSDLSVALVFDPDEFSAD